MSLRSSLASPTRALIPRPPSFPAPLIHNPFFPHLIFVLALAFLSTSSLKAQTLLAHGINPANLGKGDWIYQVSAAESRLKVSTTQALINYEAGMGMQWITVKCGDGADTNTWAQFNPTLIAQAHAAGLKVFGWAYVYGNTSNNVPGEINAALTCLDQGADGFIIDAETEYEATGQSNAAAQYCRGIRARYPDTFLAYAPFPYISDHSAFPYKVFGYYCDAVMPQDYWKTRGISPAQMVGDMDSQWTTWQNNLTGTNRLAIKPIIPLAQSYSPSSTQIEMGAEITAFVSGLKADKNPATAGGYNGISFWNSQERNTNLDLAVIAVTIGGTNPPSTPKFAAINFTSSGQIQLQLSGKIGSTYAIDLSSNLIDWIQLATFTNTAGTYQFMDTSATNQPQGYYRARLLSP